MHPQRWLLLTVAVVVAALQYSSASAPRMRPTPAKPVIGFTFESVQRIAQQRAAEPYRDRSSKLPDSLAKLSYDDYRDIRFRQESALWRNQSLFEIQFFHRGANFDRSVNVTEVGENGALRPIDYDPSLFDFGHNTQPKDLPASLGFAGLRVHFPLQTPDHKDEVIAFLGASFFRVLGRNASYGASARGLAINVATNGGEEIPYFSDFWVVRPPGDQRTLTIYALLDSPSLTGAYHFEIRPGGTTNVEVTATLYARKSVEKLGLAPLTSMYLYGEEHSRQFDDFRPEVHNSDGLIMNTGGGEWLWRPLTNPHQLRVSSFSDEHPRGFGLDQRDRDFSHYQDEDGRYQLRPSYWISPLGDWGRGRVELAEIPSEEEIHDNIVSYWVSSTALQPERPFTYAYLLSAYLQAPQWPPGGRAIATRSLPQKSRGADNARRFMVDFSGGDLAGLADSQPLRATLSAHNAEIEDVTVRRLPEDGTWRASFRLVPKGNQPVDVRGYLTLYGEALTETWTDLWTP